MLFFFLVSLVCLRGVLVFNLKAKLFFPLAIELRTRRSEMREGKHKKNNHVPSLYHFLLSPALSLWAGLGIGYE